MQRRRRRNHTPAFKAKVALAAIKGDRTLSQLAEQFDVHPNQVTSWKAQLEGGAAKRFLLGPDGNADFLCANKRLSHPPARPSTSAEKASISGALMILAHGGIAAAMVTWHEAVHSSEHSGAVLVEFAPLPAAPPAPPAERTPQPATSKPAATTPAARTNLRFEMQGQGPAVAGLLLPAPADVGDRPGGDATARPAASARAGVPA